MIEGLSKIFSLSGFWASLLASVVILLAGIALAILKKTSTIGSFFFIYQLKKGGQKYCGSELAVLKSWPTVLTSKTIDFSTDYVTLIVIEADADNVLKNNHLFSSEQLIYSDSPIVLISGPGFGKTTLLLHLHYELLERLKVSKSLPSKRSIPFFFRAKDLALKNLTLKEAISRNLIEFYGKSVAQFLIDHGLKKGWFLILVDGLDEMEGDVSKFFLELHRFIDNFPDTGVVVSSRPLSSNLMNIALNSGNFFREVAIAPLDYEAKVSLINKYSPNRDVATAVVKLIETDEFLADISKIVINLLLMINVVQGGGKINKKSDFYEYSARTLMYSVPKSKGLALKYGFSEKEEFLSRISFLNLLKGFLISPDNIWSLKNSEGLEPDVFYEITETCGLLRLVGDNVYDFLHRTFPEYFAAKYIGNHFSAFSGEEWKEIFQEGNSEIFGFLCNLSEAPNSLSRKILCYSSNPLLLSLYLTETQNVNLSVQRLFERKIWDYLSNNQRELHISGSTVRRVLSLIHRFPRSSLYKNIYVELMDQLVKPNLNKFSNFSKPEDLQIFSLRFLIHTKSKEILPRLVEIFKDPSSDVYVRFKAGELMSALSDESFLRDLERYYLENEDADVKRFLVESMIHTNSEKALGGLKLAAEDSDPVVAAMADEGGKYISEKCFLDSASAIVISDSCGESKRCIVAATALDGSDLLNIAMDKSSSFRLDAFRFLYTKCPQDGLNDLEIVALDKSENEFYRCEATKIIGSQSYSGVPKSLVKIFGAEHGGDPKNGSGTRGCAIEYLAHRGFYCDVLDCVRDIDINWRLSSEVCKIVWSVYDALTKLDNPISYDRALSIRALCANCSSSANIRVQHWVNKIYKELDRSEACKSLV